MNIIRPTLVCPLGSSVIKENEGKEISAKGLLPVEHIGSGKMKEMRKEIVVKGPIKNNVTDR